MKRIMIAVLGVLIGVVAGGVANAADLLVKNVAVDCTVKIALLDLVSQLNQSSPDNTYKKTKDGQDYYLFCVAASASPEAPPTTIELKNNTALPIVIYNLTLDGSGMMPMTVNKVKTWAPMLKISGNNITLQQMNYNAACGDVAVSGKSAVVINSTITCSAALPATSTTPILNINGNSTRASNLTITDCPTAVAVTSNGNILNNVTVTASSGKALSALKVTGIANSLSDWTITGYKNPVDLAGSTITFNKPIITRNAPPPAELELKIKEVGIFAGNGANILSGKITGYDVAIQVQGDTVKIQNSTLAGTPAVLIMPKHNNVTVSQCTFTSPNTIDFSDSAEKSDRTIFDAKLMAKELAKDPYGNVVMDVDGNDVIARVYGKLPATADVSKAFELYVTKKQTTETDYSISYQLPCAATVAADKIKLSDDDSSLLNIEKGEKYFLCDNAKNQQGDAILKIASFIRLASNNPSINLMSESTQLKDFGSTPTTAFLPGQVISGEGGALAANTEGAPGLTQSDAGATIENAAPFGPVLASGGGSSDVTLVAANDLGGSNASIPADDSVKLDSDSGSDGGANMQAANGVTLGGEGLAGGASASAGCGGSFLRTQTVPNYAFLIVMIPLLALPVVRRARARL